MMHIIIMVLKVDLQCHRCYKKVKDALCCFDEIQDPPVYDEKQNTVTIKVICCDPEKIKRKIICKAKGVIKCIEITKDKSAKTENEEKVDKPKKTPELARPPPRNEPVTHMPCQPRCPIPPPAATFRFTCCVEFYGGCRGGPCCHCCNIGCPPPSNQCDGCWKRPVCDSSGGGHCSEPPTCQTM